MSDCQFDKSLLSSEILATLPAGLEMRPLASDDFDKGFLETLSQLTTVGHVTKDQFLDRFLWLKSRNDEYFAIVIEETETHKIVGSGTIFIERKFIHETGCAGHIEDIVTHDSMRGKGLGKLLITQLIHIGKSRGAYKILLSCSQSNVGFYEKCGLVPKSVSMALYVD